MTYAEMIPVNIIAELNECFEGKRCKTTTEQFNKVAQQVEKHWGEGGFVISPLGVVFSNSAEYDFMTLGRIDAFFNFYVKMR